MTSSRPLFIAVLSLAACSSGSTSNPASDVPAATTDAGGASADRGAVVDDFANAPTCSVGGFMNLRGAAYMGSAIPGSVIAEGRPMLAQTAGPSTLSLTNSGGAAFIIRLEWNGTLRADQTADLTGAQIYLPMDQGMAAPPLDGPWADRRVCAGSGSRLKMGSNGVQFVLRNWTITTGACPGGESGADEISGCYSPNVAP